MKIDLLKELDTLNEKQKTDFISKEIEEVKLLLENNAAEEIRTLKDTGFDFHIKKQEDYTERKINLENVNKQYEGQIYHINDIQKLCMDYRLRFLNSMYYKGSIPQDLGVKLVDFKKKHNLNFNTSIHSDTGKLFVLAPSKLFKLQDRPIPLDPMLFYKVDNENYKLVHKWGNDLSPRRLILGEITKTITSINIFILLSGLIIAGIFFNLGLNNYPVLYGILVGLTIIISRMMITANTNNHWDSDHNWNNKYLTSE